MTSFGREGQREKVFKKEKKRKLLYQAFFLVTTIYTLQNIWKHSIFHSLDDRRVSVRYSPNDKRVRHFQTFTRFLSDE